MEKPALFRCTAQICTFTQCTTKGSHRDCKPLLVLHHPLALGDGNHHTDADAEYDISILCLLSSLWLLLWTPAHLARWVCSLVATLVAAAASSRAEMTIPAGWLRNGKDCLSMWDCCYAVCCPCGGEYLDKMAPISRISTDICAYLSFGHDWTTSTEGKADFSCKMTWLQGDSGVGVLSQWVTMSPKALRQWIGLQS